MTFNIPLDKAGVVLDGRPGWDMWPVCLSTSVAFCVNPPSTVHGSFWRSKEMDSPVLVVGKVWEWRRMANALSPGIGGRVRRLCA
jgi:hypothetical protein